MPSLNSVSITWDDEDRPVVTVRYQENDEGQSPVDVDEWLGALADRLGDESAKNLRELIVFNNTDGFVALVELAGRLGIEKPKIDGWNRNLGRSVKAVVRDYGFLRKDHEDGTAQILDYQWDQPGNRWTYAVPEKFRASLLTALDAR